MSKNNNGILHTIFTTAVKKLVSFIMFIVFAWAIITYFPTINMMLKARNLNFRDAQTTVELRNLSQLNTLTVVQTGTLENKTMALFNITANTLWLDYRFRGLYGVQLDTAYIHTTDNTINIYLPKPKLTDYSIDVLKIRRSDFLKPIKPEDLVLIVNTFKDNLYKKYKDETNNLNKARENAFNLIVDLIKSYLDDSSQYKFKLCDIGG